MPTFRRRPVTVEAEQWFPGKSVPGVITDPKALVNMPGMHIGHQRELDGTKGLVVTRDGPRFVHGGDWVVTDQDGDVRVCHPGAFAETYEATTQECIRAIAAKAARSVCISNHARPNAGLAYRSDDMTDILAACEAAASEARREERERCRSICEEFLDKHQHDENLARWHCAGDIQERIESGT